MKLTFSIISRTRRHSENSPRNKIHDRQRCQFSGRVVPTSNVMTRKREENREREGQNERERQGERERWKGRGKGKERERERSPKARSRKTSRRWWIRSAPSRHAREITIDRCDNFQKAQPHSFPSPISMHESKQCFECRARTEREPMIQKAERCPIKTRSSRARSRCFFFYHTRAKP